MSFPWLNLAPKLNMLHVLIQPFISKSSKLNERCFLFYQCIPKFIVNKLRPLTLIIKICEVSYRNQEQSIGIRICSKDLQRGSATRIKAKMETMLKLELLASTICLYIMMNFLIDHKKYIYFGNFPLKFGICSFCSDWWFATSTTTSDL